MKTCYKCGEHKKVREIVDFDGKFSKLSWFGHYYWYDFICEDCDKAEKILKKEQRMEEQKDWVKQRDKILKKRVKEE